MTQKETEDVIRHLASLLSHTHGRVEAMEAFALAVASTMRGSAAAEAAVVHAFEMSYSRLLATSVNPAVEASFLEARDLLLEALRGPGDAQGVGQQQDPPGR